MKAITVEDKFALFSEHFNPKIIAKFNNHVVKLAKLEGEFIWHSHEEEDELFIVIKGKLEIHFRDRIITLDAGDLYVIPHGQEHKPVANDGVVHLMYMEPTDTKHSGEIEADITVDRADMEWI